MRRCRIPFSVRFAPSNGSAIAMLHGCRSLRGVVEVRVMERKAQKYSSDLANFDDDALERKPL
jgi:hypothetical protein